MPLESPAAQSANVVSAFGTAGATSTGTIVLAAGNNITLNTGASSITLVGPTVPAATNFSLNATSSSVSLSAGAGIGIGQAASTITVSASVQTSSISLTARGNTTVSSAGTFSNLLNVSGAGIVSVGAGAGSITISASTAASAAVVSAFGTGAATSTGTIVLAAGNNITLNTGVSSITIVGPTVPAATNFSLNATSSSVSLSAGAGIGIGQAASTITVSASVQTSSISLTALGNTTSSSAGTFSNVLNISGAGIASVGVGAGSITISVPAPAASANVVSAFGTGAATSTGTIVLAAGANITLNTGANSITIVGPTPGAGGGVASLNASTGELSLSAGAGIGIGQAASTMTISASRVVSAFGTGAATSTGTIVLAAGANITLNTGANSITIVGGSVSVGGKLLFTQNYPLNQMAVALTRSGTVTGGVAWASSVFMHRIYLPAPITITEVDMAMSIGFNATSDGAGTMSRSFGIWSFSDNTTWMSVFTVSGSSAWTTGTSTAGASNSLTQFQGGWSRPLIQPMTFASTSFPAGEYVVGQRFDFAQAFSTWTLNIYGPTIAESVLASAVTDVTSATAGVLSSAGLSAASGLTGISHYASPIVWLAGGGLSANSAVNVVMRASSSVAASTYSNSKFDLTGSNSAAAAFYFGQTANLTANTFFISNLGTRAGSLFTGSTSIGAVTAIGDVINSSTLASATQANFGFIGTGSTTSARPSALFNAGVLQAGWPTNIISTVGGQFFTGSFAAQQPWFALVGS